ncbi:MAG: mechanosensitive ion channel [Chitinophagales bacterium]
MLLQSEEIHNTWSKFSDWGDSFVNALPNMIAAMAVVILFIILSRYVRKLATTIMHRRSGNPAVATVMAGFISIIFVFIGIFIALGILGLDQTVSSLLAGAGILGLVLGLALQDTLSSAVAGIVMTTRKSYRVGDFVESNGYLGTITEINLRNTTILQTNGAEVKLPNKIVLGNPLINYSLRGELRVEIQVGISYNDDLDLAEKVCHETIKNKVEHNAKKPIEVYFTQFGDSSIGIRIRFWIERYRQADRYHAESEAIKAIKKAFAANNISIPYPIQTIQLQQK